jgi:hypothetical protein
MSRAASSFDPPRSSVRPREIGQQERARTSGRKGWRARTAQLACWLLVGAGVLPSQAAAQDAGSESAPGVAPEAVATPSAVPDEPVPVEQPTPPPAVAVTPSAAPGEPAPADPPSPPPAAVASEPELAPAPSSEEAGWGDEAMDDAIGFAVAEAPSASSAPQLVPPAPGELSVAVGLSTRAALWTERLQDEPFAQARIGADVALRYKKPFDVGGAAARLRLVAEGHVEYDFAYLHARERFDQATLDAYEHQLLGRETYVAVSIGALELAFGRQIVAWGQGEVVSPVDVINPRDLREPGLAELDAIRMAVLASRAGLSLGAHRFDAMLVHEAYFGLRPAPLSDFSPLRALLLRDPAVRALLSTREVRYVDVPERFDEGTSQLYLRWSYAGHGFDLALYAASTLDKQGVLVLPEAQGWLEPSVELALWHPRYELIAHAGAVPVGAFVLRWELGFDHDRALSVRVRAAPSARVDWLRRDRVTGLLAVTYTGLEATRLSLEYAQSVVLDNPERAGARSLELFWPIESPVFALRAVRTFLREQLSLMVVATSIGVSPFVGAFVRAELAYALADALVLSAGYAVYASSKTEFGPFYGFTENDRLYAGLRWDFLLD